MPIERASLVGIKQPVDVISQARFDLFTAPGHESLRTNSHLFEQPCQLQPAPIDARLHRSLGHLQHILNLAVLEALQIAQDYGLAQMCCNLAERPLVLLPKPPHERRLVRPPGGRFFLFEPGQGVVERVSDAVAFGPPVMVNEEVAGDASHPGGKAAVRRVVTPQRAVDAQEDILAQILGLVAIAGETVAQIVDSPRVPPHKLLPGRTVAREALLNQLSIWLQLCISLTTRGASRPLGYGTQNAIEKFRRPGPALLDAGLPGHLSRLQGRAQAFGETGRPHGGLYLS